MPEAVALMAGSWKEFQALKLPRLMACRRCFSLYSDEVEGLRHECNPRVDGVQVARAVRAMKRSGTQLVSIGQIVATVDPSCQPGDPTYGALETFVKKFGSVLGLREVNHVVDQRVLLDPLGRFPLDDEVPRRFRSAAEAA